MTLRILPNEITRRPPESAQLATATGSPAPADLGVSSDLFTRGEQTGLGLPTYQAVTYAATSPKGGVFSPQELLPNMLIASFGAIPLVGAVWNGAVGVMKTYEENRWSHLGLGLTGAAANIGGLVGMCTGHPVMGALGLVMSGGITLHMAD